MAHSALALASVLDDEAACAYDKRVGALGSAEARRAFASDLRLRRWLPVWWRDAGLRLAPSTQGGYLRQIRLRILPHLGDLPLAELDAAAVALWLDLLRFEGSPDTQVQIAMSTLSSVLHHAAQRGLLPEGNAVRNVDPAPRKRLRKPRPLSPEQTECLRMVLMTDDGRRGHARRALRSATLVSLFAYGGLRPSEAMGAKAVHVDLNASGLWVRDTVSAEHRVDLTKTGDYRFARLPRAVLADLQRWMAAIGVEGDDWLFPNVEGNVTASTYPTWGQEFRRARGVVRQARPECTREFDRVTPKTLRHSCASVRLRAGDPVAEIAADLGHSVDTLVRWYLHEIRASKGLPVVPVDEQIATARRQYKTDESSLLLARSVTGPSRRSRYRPRRPPAPPDQTAALHLVGNRYEWRPS